MNLAFCPTIGQRLYYMGDLGDDFAPMLRLEFCNELAEKLSPEKKERIAQKALSLAIEMVNEEGGI